jgi:hypothetical protein
VDTTLELVPDMRQPVRHPPLLFLHSFLHSSSSTPLPPLLLHSSSTPPPLLFRHSSSSTPPPLIRHSSATRLYITAPVSSWLRAEVSTTARWWRTRHVRCAGAGEQVFPLGKLATSSGPSSGPAGVHLAIPGYIMGQGELHGSPIALRWGQGTHTLHTRTHAHMRSKDAWVHMHKCRLTRTRTRARTRTHTHTYTFAFSFLIEPPELQHFGNLNTGVAPQPT